MDKLKYLDGIRGISALIVFVHHFTLAFMPLLFWGDPSGFEGEPIKKIIHYTPVGIIINGNFAVCMFFVLSGYVLSHKFFLTGDKQLITNSAYRRYIRLGIPVFISVIISYLILKTGGYFNKEVGSMTESKWFTEFWTFEPSLWSAIKNGLFGALIIGDTSYNSVLWTLKWELFGSFLVYSFLALFGNSSKRYIAYMVVIALSWDSYYFGFMLGVLACDVQLNKSWSYIKNKAILFTLLVIGIYLGSFPVDFTQNVGYKFLYPEIIVNQLFILSHILGAFLILIFTLNSPLLQKFMSTRPFLFLGNISYSLYLLHLLLIGSFSAFLFKMLIKSFSYKLAYSTTFLLSTLLVLVVSYIFYKYVDQKSIKLSKKYFSI